MIGAAFINRSNLLFWAAVAGVVWWLCRKPAPAAVASSVLVPAAAGVAGLADQTGVQAAADAAVSAAETDRVQQVIADQWARLRAGE